jgi:hypothetical protein
MEKSPDLGLAERRIKLELEQGEFWAKEFHARGKWVEGDLFPLVRSTDSVMKCVRSPSRAGSR